MSQDSLISKLEELDRLFTDIGKQMEDPAIASDPQKIVQLSMEHSQLSRIVTPYREYKKLVDDSDQAQMILDDPESDADMRDSRTRSSTNSNRKSKKRSKSSRDCSS